MMTLFFSCTYCNRRFSEIQELEDHVSQHTENELPLTDQHLQSIEEDSKKDNTKEMEFEENIDIVNDEMVKPQPSILVSAKEEKKSRISKKSC